MSIFDYTDGSHPEGWLGYRVSVQYGGKHHQKYFNCRGLDKNQTKAYLDEAEILEAKWLKLKAKAKAKFNKEAEPTCRAKHSTGVRGIAYKLVCSPDRHGNSKAYAHWRYVVQIRHNHMPFYGSFFTFEEAVKYYAKSKGIRNYKHLLERYHGN